MRRLSDWLDRHPAAVDALVVLVLSYPVLVATVSLAEAGRNEGWYLLWGLSYLVPLLWRRTRPDLAAALLVLPHLVQVVVWDYFTLANATVPVVLYAVAAYGRYPRWWLATALLAAAVAAWDWTYPAPMPGASSDGQMLLWAVQAWLLVAAVSTVAWFMGMLARQRRMTVRSYRDRAEALEREREQGLRLAAQEERSRIAREMHDVVAHSLSVIVVQADGAAYAARAGGQDPQQRAETTARALSTIGDTARAALTETRRLVGVLRSEGAVPDLAPQATLGQIGDLVDQLRRAGFPVAYEVVGHARSHPAPRAGVEMAAYRVVQEALTNVLKHAGPGASVLVRLEHSPEGLRVTVRDDGRGAQGADGLGHGLIGMRERVAAYGGTLAARNRDGGGYEVVASLPAPGIGAPAGP